MTFYNLLVGDRISLKNYAGNKKFIGYFKFSNCAIAFRIYGGSMDDKMKAGMNRRKLFDESAVSLSKCLPIFNPSHLIVRNILDCIMSK